MKLINGIDQLAHAQRPTVASIGNFDGVHLGHREVVKTLMSASERLQLPATVITFAPLAREFFAPATTLRLASLAQRAQSLFDLGVEQVLCIQFDAEFAVWTPEHFIQRVLVEGLGIKYLSVGDDFRFGHKRAGDFGTLRDAGSEHDFEVCSHETFAIDGERVSSGRLRDAVASGDFTLAQRLLGHPYRIAGEVAKGRQLGRTIGFPTANIALDATPYAVQGVYAVWVELADGSRQAGVANVGNRPTVDGSENRLEVHLFDFQGDLYGENLSVEFVAKLRDEQKFAEFAELQAQIKQDAAQARALLLAAK